MEEAIALDSIQAIAASFGASFDAEKIIDTVLEKDGTRYYKVRWVKYSWEPAASFTHLEHLIREFWNQFGQTPESLQNVANKRQITPSKISLTQELPTQVQSSTNDPGIASILTSNPIADDITQVQSADTLQIQPSAIQIPTSFTHLTALSAAVTPQHVDIMPQIQQIPLAEPIQQASQGLNDGNPTMKMIPDKRTRGSGSTKKRRKIPGNCPICGKFFKSTTNIAAHKKLHTEERQYHCQECGKKFRRKLHLSRHLESHAGIKSFVCGICGASFSSKWYMQAHAVIHTGDKPFECDTCQKRFNNKANLNKHKLIHANKRPFVCNICGHTYRQSYDLKRHMTTHSEAKDHACEQCGKTFARRTYLQRHLLTHNGEKKFSCTLCNRKFFQKGHLNFHMKQHKDKIRVSETTMSQKSVVSNISVLSVLQKVSNPPVNNVSHINNRSLVRELTNRTSETTTAPSKNSGPVIEIFKGAVDAQERATGVHSIHTGAVSTESESSLITQKEGIVTVVGNIDNVEDGKHIHNNMNASSPTTGALTKSEETYFTEPQNGILEFSNSNQVMHMYLS